MADVLQELLVRLSTDVSGLARGFDEAKARANDIEARFNRLVETTQGLGYSFKQLGETVGAEAQQQLQPFSNAAQSVIDKEAGLQQAVTTAAGALQELHRAYLEGAVSAGTLARAQEELQQATDRYSASTKESADAGFDFKRSLLDMAKSAGVVVGTYDLLKQALSAYAEDQRNAIALSALTGQSFAEAAQKMDALRDVALQFAVAKDALESFQLRMTAFGATANQIGSAMTAVANTAGATRREFDTVAGSFERMALGGMAGARQLVTLGISAKELGDAMGVSASEVTKAFKEMDFSQRVEVLNAALRKYQGVAEQVAHGIAGQWQNLKNQMSFILEDIGKLLVPLAATMISTVQLIIESAKHLSVLDFKNFKLELQSVGDVAERTNARVHAALSQKFVFEGGTGAIVEEMNKLHDANKDAFDEVKKALQVYQELVKSYEHGTVTAGGYVATQRDVNTALAAYQEKAKAAGIVTDALAAAFKTLNRESLSTVAENFQKAEAAYATIIRSSKSTGEDWARAFDALEEAAKKANESLEPIYRAFVGLDQLTGPRQLARDMDILGSSAIVTALRLEALNAAQNAEGWKGFDLVMASVAGRITGLGKALVVETNIDKVLGPLRQMTQMSEVSAEQLRAEWDAVSRVFNHLAKSDLPAAIALNNDYIESLKRAGAPASEIYALQEKQLQLEILLRQERGQSANAQIIALENLRIKTQNLIESTSRLGQLYVLLMANLRGAFTTVDQAIAHSIVHIGEFGRSWKTAAESIAESILNTIIAAALKPLWDAIATTIGKWVAAAAIKKTLDVASAATEITTSTAAASSRVAASVAADTAEVSGSAAVAAARAFAAYIGIPFAGWALAIAAAAATIAAVMGFKKLISAEGGADLGPEGALLRAHPYETVLPKNLADGYRRIIQIMEMGLIGTPQRLAPAAGVEFHNCTFNGVTQDLVNNVMNQAIKRVRRIGARV